MKKNKPIKINTNIMFIIWAIAPIIIGVLLRISGGPHSASADLGGVIITFSYSLLVLTLLIKFIHRCLHS